MRLVGSWSQWEMVGAWSTVRQASYRGRNEDLAIGVRAVAEAHAHARDLCLGWK